MGFHVIFFPVSTLKNLAHIAGWRGCALCSQDAHDETVLVRCAQ